jgi:hypothetical protein
MPLRSAISGSITRRAVSPGTSKIALAKVKPRKSQNGRLVKQRDQRHREPADEVGEDRHLPPAEPVDEHAAKDAGEESRQGKGHAGESGASRATGGFQDEPGQRHQGHHVPEYGQAVRCQEDGDRKPGPRFTGERSDHLCPERDLSCAVNALIFRNAPIIGPNSYPA